MLKYARIPAGLFLIAHGVAHLMATAVYWKLTESPDLPYTTEILNGQVDLGGAGIVIFGYLWLLAGVAIACGGAGLLARLAWTNLLLVVAIPCSLVLCILVYDRAYIGLIIDVLIMVLTPVVAMLSSSRLRATRAQHQPSR